MMSTLTRCLDWRPALSACAASTLRNHRADMENFESCCLKEGARSLLLRPRQLRLSLQSQAENCAVPTLKRRLAAIRNVHRLLRMENPVTGGVDPRAGANLHR